MVNGEIYQGQDRDDVVRDENRERRRRSRTYNLSYLSADQANLGIVEGKPSVDVMISWAISLFRCLWKRNLLAGGAASWGQVNL